VTLLAGDTALVTGAASGIGRGIAIALAREGARVVLSDVDAQRGAAVVAPLQAEGLDVRFIAADLAAEAGPVALLHDALEALGELSIVVHSASPRRLEADTILAVSDATWEQMLAVNVRAGFILARGAGRQMMARNIKGRMLFITSLHAHTPRNLPHYSAAKAAQTMLVKELARALGPHGIRVNAIAPGWIETDMSRKALEGDPARKNKILGRTPMARLGTPDDVGWAAVYLASPAARFVTGVVLPVDGGASIGF